ncbi:glycine receptor subunit beta-like [Haemaphysalis longicornis]
MTLELSVDGDAFRAKDEAASGGSWMHTAGGPWSANFFWIADVPWNGSVRFWSKNVTPRSVPSKTFVDRDSGKEPVCIVRGDSIEEGQPVKVYVSMVVLDLGRLIEAERVFLMQAYLYARWTDPRLNVPADVVLDEAGTPLPRNVRQRLWRPLVTFENALEKGGTALGSGATVMYKEKHLYSVSRHHLKVQCKMDLAIFPVDTQRCALYLRNSVEHNGMVQLEWSQHNGGKHWASKHPNVKMLRIPSDSRFSIEQPSVGTFNSTLIYGDFATLYVPFVFYRRLTTRALKTYLPTSLIVILSWAGLWFDQESVSARVGVGVSSVLAMMIQIGKEHHDDRSFTALDIWLFACGVMVLATILELVLSLGIGRSRFEQFKEEQFRRMPEAKAEPPKMEGASADVGASGNVTPAGVEPTGAVPIRPRDEDDDDDDVDFDPESAMRHEQEEGIEASAEKLKPLH